VVKNGIACPHYLVFQTSQCGFAAGRRRGVGLQSQEGQDLCAAGAAEHLIFKTSTAEQTVDLTNKDMTKDSQRLFVAMVSQRVENNRTDPLICISRWMHEVADLR
jgi:hypothetical protein